MFSVSGEAVILFVKKSVVISCMYSVSFCTFVCVCRSFMLELLLWCVMLRNILFCSVCSFLICMSAAVFQTGAA